MRSYTTHERKGTSRASEAAIVYTAPYFAKENYTFFDRFIRLRNQNADVGAAGVLSILPTATNDSQYVPIIQGATVSIASLGESGDFFLESSQSTLCTLSSSESWGDIVFGNGIWVAVAPLKSYVSTSPDGVVWTQRATPIAHDSPKIAFGNGVFVRCGFNSNIVLTSPDGVVWTQRTMSHAIFASDITFGGGLFAMTSSQTEIRTSPDGIVWTTRSALGHRCIAHGNGIFVAMQLAVNNQCSTSSDGIGWTTRTLPTSVTWMDIAFGGGAFTAVGQSSTGIATKNGINWTQHLLPENGTWYVGFVGRMFAAVKNNSSVMAISGDGSSWFSKTLPSSSHWSAISGGDNKLVVVANTPTATGAVITPDTNNRITETPTLTLPANHSYFVKIT
jgi:hypothetical protein